MIVDLLEIFSSRLKQLMNTESINMQQLSIKAKVSRKSISMYLKGLYPPRYNSLAKISDYFEVAPIIYLDWKKNITTVIKPFAQ